MHRGQQRVMINPVKMVDSMDWTFSPYRAVNTLQLRYKNQSVSAV